MLSKKNVSIAMISLMILPFFIAVPFSTALGSTYIAVNPSVVRSGDDVYVKGYNFNSYQVVDVYWNTTDDYNYLGSAQADAWGRFSFKFLMQETYPGVYNIIVITNPDVYTAKIEVIATSPLDQRLIDLINALSLGVGDINDTLNDIYTEVTNMEAKLDEGGSFYTFVDGWFNAIQGNISNGFADILGNITDVKQIVTQNGAILDDIWSLTDNVHGWANLTEALDDVKDEIITIDGIVDDINYTVGGIESTLANQTDHECLVVEIQTVERDMDLNLVGEEWADYFFSTNIGGSDYRSDVYVIVSFRGQRIVPTNISAEVKDGNQYTWHIFYFTIDDDVDDIQDVWIYTYDAVEPGSYLVVVDVEYDDPLSGLTYYGTGSYIIECTETILLE